MLLCIISICTKNFLISCFRVFLFFTFDIKGLIAQSNKYKSFYHF